MNLINFALYKKVSAAFKPHSHSTHISSGEDFRNHEFTQCASATGIQNG